MARFNIFTGHLRDGPLESVREHHLWIVEGLRACGHEAEFGGDLFASDAINIFMEWFVPGEDRFFDFMNGEAKRGHPYIIVVTEKVNAGSFNQPSPGTIKRFQRFAKVAKRARAVWTFVGGDEKKLQGFVTKNAAHIEMGWCDQLYDPVPEAAHKYDFTLHGTGSESRKALAGELRDRGYSVVYHHAIVPWEQKEAEQRLARVVLSPRMFNWFPIPSGTRIARTLHTSSACAVEWCPAIPRPQCYAPASAEGQNFADFAEGLLPGYQKIAEASTERYRAEMPGIGECVQRCLDLSGSL